MADANGNNSRIPAGALFSTAFPNAGVAAGAISSSGNMVPLNADPNGNLLVAGNFTATLGGTTAVNVTLVGGSAIVLGQAAMASSFPVVIASNQSAIPVTGSFSATNPAVGTTGTTAPTSADFVGVDIGGNLQGWSGLAVVNATAYAGRIDLSSLNGTALSIGQQVMTASIPVVLASNQSNVTTVLGAALPAGTNPIGTVSALQVGTWTINFSGAGTMLRGNATASSTAAVVIIAAQNATTKIYVTGLQFGNTSGSTLIVTLNDTAASQFIVPSGGGSNIDFLIPLALATANSSLTFAPSLAVSTVYANAQGYGAS
jgi:hypothetical protein